MPKVKCPCYLVLNPATGNCVSRLGKTTAEQCPPGKSRSPSSYRCVATKQAKMLHELAAVGNLAVNNCDTPLKIRNPKTNRCVKKTSSVGRVLTNWDCDKILDPITGNWVFATSNAGKAVVASVYPPCPEGKVRNPATRRCRKVVRTHYSSSVSRSPTASRSHSPSVSRSPSVARTVARLPSVSPVARLVYRSPSGDDDGYHPPGGVRVRLPSSIVARAARVAAAAAARSPVARAARSPVARVPVARAAAAAAARSPSVSPSSSASTPAATLRLREKDAARREAKRKREADKQWKRFSKSRNRGGVPYEHQIF